MVTVKQKIAYAALSVGAAALIGGSVYRYIFYKQRLSPGWHTDSGGDYYVISKDGDKATGFYKIDENTYMFSDDGYLLSGWQEHGGETYYLSDEGILQRGVVEIDGVEYCFNEETGEFHTGVQEIDGLQFIFDEHGFTDAGFLEKDSGTFYFNSDGTAAEGWSVIDGKEYYFLPTRAWRTALRISAATPIILTRTVSTFRENSLLTVQIIVFPKAAK